MHLITTVTGNTEKRMGVLHCNEKGSVNSRRQTYFHVVNGVQKVYWYGFRFHILTDLRNYMLLNYMFNFGMVSKECLQLST